MRAAAELVGHRVPALLLGLAVGFAAASGALADTHEDIAGALARGGYNIFWRHTHTGKGSDLVRYTTDDAELADCSRQRDLDAEGEADAVAVGEGLRQQGIPVTEVLSSAFCRTIKSARLAFGEALAKREDGLLSVCQASRRAFDANTARLRELLASVPPAGGNRVLVSHNCNIRALVRLLPSPCAWEPAMGDAVVFRPSSDAPGFEFVDCLTLEQMRGWSAQGG